MVRARLDHEVRDRRLPAAELGAQRAGLQLELLMASVGANLVVAAALQVAAERNAFDQDFVRVVAAAVDRPLERPPMVPGRLEKMNC